MRSPIKKYWLFIILPLGLVLLLVGGRFFLYDYSARLIGDLLFEIVQLREEDAPYEFSSKAISFFPFERELVISELTIEPKVESEDTLTTSYKIHFPEFSIDVSSLTDIYFKKKLSIDGISLKSPSILVKKDGENKPIEKKPIPVRANDLYLEISKYLKKLNVDYFDLTDGQVSFFSDTSDVFEIENFDLKISNFSMDSSNLQYKENIFYTEKVLLKIKNQSFQLGDEEHHARFDSLIFSSADSTFRVYNFRYRNLMHPDKQDSVNIPLVQLTNINFDAYYSRNVIDLGTILLDAPYIHLHPRQRRERRVTNEKVLQNELNSAVWLDSLVINNGSFSYLNEDTQIRAEKLNLHHGFYSVDPGQELFIMDEFIRNISLSTESVIIDANKFDLRARRIDLKGKTEDLEIFDASGVYIGQNNRINLDLPYARLRQYELIGDHFVIDSLWLKDSNLSADIQTSKNEGSKRSPGYHFGINYLNTANINVEAQIDTINLDISGINLLGYDVSDTLALDNLQRVKWVIDKIDALTPAEAASIENWSYNGMTNNMIAENLKSRFGTIGMVQLFNPDYRNIKNGQVNFDSMKVSNADLVLFLSDTKKDTSGKRTFNYEKIAVLNSTINVKTKENSIAIEKLNVDVRRNNLLKMISAEILTFDQENLKISSTSSNLIDSTNSLVMQGIAIANKDQLEVNIDSLALLGLKDSIYLDSIPAILQDLEEIVLSRPVIKGKLQGGKGIKLDSSFSLPPLSLTDGQVELTLATGAVFRSEDFSLKLSQGISAKNLTNTLESARFRANDLSYSDSETILSVGKLSQENRIINILDSRLQLPNKTAARIDSIRMDGPDFNAWQDDSTITMQSLLVSGIFLNLDSLANKKQNSKPKIPAIDIAFARFRNLNTTIPLPDQQLKLRNIELDLENMEWGHSDSLSSFLAKSSMSLSGPEISYELKKQNRSVNTGRFIYDDKLRRLTIKDLRTSPTQTRTEFMIEQAYESDWIVGSSSELIFDDIDFRGLLFEKRISLQKLSVMDFDIFVYRDKRLPDPVEYKSLPHAHITRSPWQLEIDTVFVKTKKITYTERNDKSPNLARLYFNNVNAYVFNIYSDSVRIADNPPLRLLATGDIMQNGFFETEVEFETLDTLGRYEMKGTIGNMDLTQLNPILENSALVSVVSGYNNNLEFDFAANNEYALGEMKFYYDDLKINVLNRDIQPKGLGAGFKTFFANTFIVNKRNPHFLFVRQGDIYFERDEERSIINYWAKALLSGVVTSIGARNNKKEIRQLNEKSKQRLERKIKD